MRKSWQIKVLLVLLGLFILNNIESFFLKIVESIVRIPLNFNSLMSNVVGVDMWSRIVVSTSNPILLIIAGLIMCIILIGLIRSIEAIRKG